MNLFCYGSAILAMLVMLALIWGTPEYANRSHRPQGLARWTGRLFSDDLAEIRFAVRYWKNNVLTELVKQ